MRDTGLLQIINRNPAALAAECENRITPQIKTEWQKGTVKYWVMEGHWLAKTVAYADLPRKRAGLGEPALM